MRSIPKGWNDCKTKYDGDITPKGWHIVTCHLFGVAFRITNQPTSRLADYSTSRLPNHSSVSRGDLKWKIFKCWFSFHVSNMGISRLRRQ